MKKSRVTNRKKIFGGNGDDAGLGKTETILHLQNKNIKLFKSNDENKSNLLQINNH